MQIIAFFKPLSLKTLFFICFVKIFTFHSTQQFMRTRKKNIITLWNAYVWRRSEKISIYFLIPRATRVWNDFMSLSAECKLKTWKMTIGKRKKSDARLSRALSQLRAASTTKATSGETLFLLAHTFFFRMFARAFLVSLKSINWDWFAIDSRERLRQSRKSQKFNHVTLNWHKAQVFHKL